MSESLPLPATGKLSDIVVANGKVFFSITVDAGAVEAWEAIRERAQKAVAALPGVQSVMVALTAERIGSAARGAPSRPQASPAARPRPGAPPGPAAPSPAGIPGVAAIIAIASGKGGVGKTWFSITLAHAMAKSGKKALLFDGDLGLANVDVQLGVTPDHDLASVIAGDATLTQAATRFEGGFDIIAGRSGSGGLATLPATRLLTLRTELHLLAQKYDWVVLDLGAGIERTVRLLTQQSRACLVVTTDEPTAITDAYAYIKVTALEKLADGIQIVVNMVPNQRDGERVYGTLLKACREFLKIEPPLAGIIRRDDHVKDSIRRQVSLLTRHPGSDAAQDVEAIFQRLDDGL